MLLLEQPFLASSCQLPVLPFLSPRIEDSAKFLIKRDGQNGTEKALSSRFGPLSSRLASSVPFLPFFCPVLAGSHWRRVPFWVRTGWPKCGIGCVEQARPVSVPFARGGEHGLGPFGLGPARASFFFPHIIRVVERGVAAAHTVMGGALLQYYYLIYLSICLSFILRCEGPASALSLAQTRYNT